MDNYQQIGSQNVLEKTITAKTKPEVREKLFNLYGMNYKITDIKPVFHGGFLGFFQHCEYVAKYVVNNAQAEQEESFQEAQKKIRLNDLPKSEGDTGEFCFNCVFCTHVKDSASKNLTPQNFAISIYRLI